MGDRVVGVPDLRGRAALSQPVATLAPVKLIDGDGNRCWRFNQGGWAAIDDALTLASTRTCTVVLVMRVHNGSSATFFAPRFQADGLTGAATAGAVRISASSGATPAVFGPTVGGPSYARMVPGAQKQVLTFTSRTNANGGVRASVNLDAAVGSQQGVSQVNTRGGLIGASYSGTGGSVSVSQTGFDLYEFALFEGAVSNDRHDAIAAAAVANHAIPAITGQLVLEGDSITQGVGDIVSGDSLGMALTAPGPAQLIPPSVRVINRGVSGNKIADLVARRDAANTLADLRLDGGANIVAVQVGRNDWTGDPASGAAVYDGIVALFDTPSTGYLQRGWNCVAAVNIASSASFTGAVAQQRGLLTGNLLADTQAVPGGAFGGRVSLLRTDRIELGGAQLFDTSAQAASQIYYQGDSTHPSAAGTLMLATGGDTPANGYGGIV